MDKINVNAIVGKDYNPLEAEQGSRTALQHGDIVDGIITNVSDMISIAFNDKEVKIPQSAIQNAKEGQVRKFEIKDISNKSIVLREIGTNSESTSTGVLQTNVLTGGKAFSGYIRERSSQDLISQTETVNTQLEQVRATLTIEDYVNLKDLDKSPEESSSEEFEKKLERIKEQRQFSEKHLDKQIEKLDVKRESIERYSISAITGNAKDIEKRLDEAGLPVTKANIDRVSTALEMASQASSLTEEAKVYLIDNELQVTPENIYKATYSGRQTSYGKDTVGISEEQWQELKPKVEDLLIKEGLPADEKNLQIAKWLLSKELPITTESIEQLSALNSLQGNYRKEHILDLCILGMTGMNYPEKTDLIQAEKNLDNISKTISTMELLQQLSDEAAEQVKPDEIITLQQISEYQKTEQQSGKVGSKEIKNIVARRQLEEIRQRLTMENCYHMYQQGIEVDTESLEKVINQLKEIEESYYRQFYQKGGIEPNGQQVDLLKVTDQVVNELKTMPEAILAATFSMRRVITLNGLYEAGRAEESATITVKASSQMESYGTLMTAPRRDMGDTMKKAFASVDHLLQELGMEATESNRQAVRILGYNSMEITKEQIIEMKGYQLQVQKVARGLTPQVAVSLIQEGDNPLDIPLSELNEKLEVMGKSLDTTSEEKFSEYLYKLDQKKSLTKEERDAYIGVYRLLYQVEKSDGAAVGAVVKANQELTLGNLLTAVRSKKKEGMNIVAEESFGGVDAITKGSSISEQINRVFIGRQMTQQVYQQLEPDLIDRTYEPDTMDDFMDLRIEQLYEEAMSDVEKSISPYEENRYQELISNFGKTKEAAMLVANGQVVSANQLEAAGILMAEGSTLYRDIKEQALRLDEGLANNILNLYEGFEENLGEDQVRTSLQNLTDELNLMFEKSLEREDVTEGQVKQLQRYHNCIQLAGSLSHQQTFELPVIMGQEVVNLKVKLVEGQKDVSTIKIQMSSQDYGTLDALAVVKEAALQAYVVCDDRQVVAKMKEQDNALRKEIESLGVKVEELTITMNRKSKEFYRTDITEKAVGEKPSNQLLYQIAKIFIKYAKKTYK